MMWELIAANRRRSILLFVGMALLLAALGYLIGEVATPGGGRMGLVIAAGVWLVQALASVFGGSSVILAMSRAREVTPELHPQLFNVVEEMKIAAGLEKMPRVYVMDERAPNAFATGLSPDDATIVVTAGLLERLDRDELQGVVAHETAHIVNRDMQFMTLAGIMVGSIVLISEVFLRSMWYGGGSSRRYRGGRDSGGGGALILVAAIVLAIVGPVFARLLYFAMSRRREYLADACAARLTRYPEGLASALEKISHERVPMERASAATAPLYIVAPLRARGGRSRSRLEALGATHPPIQDRIAVLRAMTHGAALSDYQSAWERIHGAGASVLPPSARAKREAVALRAPSVEAPAADAASAAGAGAPGAGATPGARTDVAAAAAAAAGVTGGAGASGAAAGDPHRLFDLMRAVNGFAFLTCACGLRMKLPPDWDEPSVRCPRCGRENTVGRAEVAAMAAAAAALGEAATLARPEGGAATGRATSAPEVLTYTRRGAGWESFSCACGHLFQLSPAFRGTRVRCPKCSRVTVIEGASAEPAGSATH